MPKKLLPWIKREQHQKPPELQRQNPENPLNEVPSQTPVNLISRDDVYSEGDIYVFKFSNVLPSITLFIYSVFIFLVIYNFYLNLNLVIEKKEQTELMRSISNYSAELEIGREVQEKTAMYREILGSRLDFKVKMNTLIKTLPDNMYMHKLTIKNEGFEIEIEGDNILLFARLILIYIGSENVDEISIRSAVKNASKDTYTVVLTGVFENDKE